VLRTPVDRVMLVGGMSFATRPDGDDSALYLFLRTTVQELRDDVRKAAPIEPARGDENQEAAKTER
jgi:hypothetical protein